MSTSNTTAEGSWKKALANLPGSPEHIPAFFFSHGSPSLAFDMGIPWMGPNGPLAKFLADFGPAILKKYNPKAIVVFSAHWETAKERLVTDYGDENPLLYDYYGFPKTFYDVEFKSKGDSTISQRVVQLFKEAGLPARTTSKLESRGQDGRGFKGPGFDHGVFIPFRIMFGETFLDVPIIEASIDHTLSPEDNWKIGSAVKKLRDEGVLVLSGGLPIHNLRDFSGFSPDTASDLLRSFDKGMHEAVSQDKPEERKKAMINLVNHPGFRAAHPREDHFVPLYVAAGAGEGEGVTTLVEEYAFGSFAFGS
ncbi:Extradiol ring-cleavage dioxygenase, class III enzyme, subunit B [Flagelloscypha sp. PMI_526]|nr:Extradiol ring-cleavage dioxygenase, class III enzyme, subunit B [Flagelloscypha sp. PMI_526]